MLNGRFESVEMLVGSSKGGRFFKAPLKQLPGLHQAQPWKIKDFK